MRELASFDLIFRMIKQRGDPMLEAAQKAPETCTYYACAMVVIRFLEGTSWGYSEMLMHQRLDKDTAIALKVTYNLLLRLKQAYREDKVLGPAIQRQEDVPAIYCPEPVYQRIYSHNQLDKIICMQQKSELESSELREDAGHFQFLENQIFRKTYVSAKKEIDEWLRSYSYVKGRAQEEGPGSHKPPMDRDENDFLTQLQRGQAQNQDRSVGGGPSHNAAKRAQSELSLHSDVISVAQYRHQHSVKTLTRDFLKKLKNPDLNLDGTLKPASSRKSTHHPRNLTTLHYDQNDPFAVAKA